MPARKFSFDSSALEQSMARSTSASSFVDLFTPELRPSKPPSKRASYIDINAPSIDVADEGNNATLEVSAGGSEVETFIDEAIDSVIESSCSENEQGLFLKEISKFLSEVDSPFRHVDLWVPMDVSQSEVVGKKHIGGSSSMATTSSGNVTGIIYGGQEALSVRLSHAGCITVRSPPRVTNRLNEFGMYSKNFSFSPGFGLPGRVYLSKIPSWENNLSMLNSEQFARVGGAKIYGVNTCLCIPINTPIGMMVVALYSMQNLSRDLTWERKCMQHLWKLKPEPKWKLTIDVGLKTADNDDESTCAHQGPSSSPRNSSAKTRAFVIPPSPTRGRSPQRTTKPQPASNIPWSTPLSDKKHGAEPVTSPYCWNEQSLALLLGKYIPLDRNSSGSQLASNPVSNNQDVAVSLMSLRLLLLRHSSCRTSAESKMVNIIMGKYHSYIGACKKEHDLILSVVNDWKQLAGAQFSSPGHNPHALAHNFGINGSSSMSSLAPTDDFSLAPLAAFGSGLQSIANVASSISEQIDVNKMENVPRVVSEQGPIERNFDEGGN